VLVAEIYLYINTNPKERCTLIVDGTLVICYKLFKSHKFRGKSVINTLEIYNGAFYEWLHPATGIRGGKEK
jgi:hypothetical protein